MKTSDRNESKGLNLGLNSLLVEEVNDCYSIADCNFYIHGEELCKAVKSMPGFAPFRFSDSKKDSTECGVPVFHIRLSDVSYKGTKESQYTFESDGVKSEFSSIGDGYLLEMHHDDGTHLLLWSHTVSRTLFIEGNLVPQMLRFALWMAFGIMTVNYHRIPIHGSCIVHGGRAYLFLGESGTGKSTHTRLWREFIEGSTLLNDDSPIIVSKEDGIFIYGSPWSGKTPCYKAECYPLGGCVRLSQAPFNKMTQLSLLKAYASLHPSCPPEFAYDDELYAGISQTLDTILSKVPVYHLACLPNQEAANLSYQVLTGQSSDKQKL